MKVFCSYRTSDRSAVESFARRLREGGVDAWFDHWEIAPGDDIVARMDEGVDGCDAALIFISSAWFDGAWARDEYTSLALRKVEDGIRLIPVMLEDVGPRLPARLRKLARRSVEDFDAIRDALLGVDHRPGVADALRSPSRSVTVQVDVGDDGSATGTLEVDGEQIAAAASVPLPGDVSLIAATSPQLLADAGRRVGRVVFAGEIGATLERLVTEGEVVDLCVQSADEQVMSLPLEAATLDDGRAVALLPAVRVWRRWSGATSSPPPPAAGPLKVLVAVGAPDEGFTPNVALDIEAEMGSILDAVSDAVRDERAQVRVLEIANADTIREALAEDDYHVLHLSGHGGAGAIELEDEDGQAVQVSGADLADALQGSGKRVPLVFVSSCQRGGESASLALQLQRGGVSRVMAMQAPVTDGYATALARVFYRELSRAPAPRAAVALAAARRQLERDAGRDSAPPQRPEWATPTLLMSGDDAPLIDADLPQVALRRPPVHVVSGPVPALDWRELVGRRREVRMALRALRGDPRFTEAHGDVGAVVLTGMGGVGKSSVAGRVWARLSEQGWVCSATDGTWSLEAVCHALVRDLDRAHAPWADRLRSELERLPEDDGARLEFVERALREHPLLLIFDNFEDNLTVDGSAFLDPGRAAVLERLVDAGSRGKLLITSRYPLPGATGGLYELAVGPLSAAETRRLFLRLDGLKRLGRDDVALVRSLIGGHPRVLEFLDALVRRGASVDRVRPKLRELADLEHIDPAAERDLEAAIAGAVRLGAADIVLEELLATLDDHEREVLFQVAVSGLPVTSEDLAVALAEAALDRDAVERAAASLVDLSLLVRVDDGLWVHRWTAQALRARQPEREFSARCHRAGELRLRRIQTAPRSIDEGIEATESFLAAGSVAEAVNIGLDVAEFLARSSTLHLLTFAGQLRRALNASDPSYKLIADHEAKALRALGFTTAALELYRDLIAEFERLAAAEPDRADYQRDLSVSYERLGDVQRALGQGEQARALYTQSLETRQRLAAAEPDRADYQRDLSIAYNKLGDVQRALGQGEHARVLYTQSLEIRRRLAAAEPDHADYQRDLSVSYSKLGDVQEALGRSEQARVLYTQSLEIFQRLAAAEPDRADYQRDVAVAYSRLGGVQEALGQGERARDFYTKDLEIAERLAAGEPDRADYQRDLSVSYERLGDLQWALGQGEQARVLYTQSLEIRRRLAAAEPDRADYQRDLSVSYSKLGDVQRALGEGERARDFYTKDLEITERLAASEPDRADYQRDLSVSYSKLGDVQWALGQGEQARVLYTRSLEITERLAAGEPDRADYQRDLSVSYERLGDVQQALGDGELARDFYTQCLEILQRLAAAEPDRVDYQRDLATISARLDDRPSASEPTRKRWWRRR